MKLTHILNEQNESTGLTAKCLFVFLSICVIMLYCSPYVLSRIVYGTWNFETFEYYSDRTFNFSLAQTAKSWGINFLDPLDRTYPIFYQRPFYWMLGLLARVSRMNPWAVANIMQCFVPALFLIVFKKIADEIKLNLWYRNFALFLIFFCGPFEPYLGKIYGAHANILPFSHLLIGSYSDTYGIFFGFSGMLFLLRIINKAKCRINHINEILFCLFATLASVTQLLCFIFFFVLYFLIIFFSEFEKILDNKSDPIMITSIICGLTLSFTGTRLIGMTELAIAGGLFFVATLILSGTKRLYFMMLLYASMVFIFTAYNLKIVSDAGLNALQYQENVRLVDLTVPLNSLLVAFLPLSIAIFMNLISGSKSFIATAIFFTALIMTQNASFGYNNHPYRFITMAYPLVALASAIVFQNFFRNYKGHLKRNVLATAVIFIAVSYSAYSNSWDYKNLTDGYFGPKDRLEQALIDELKKISSQYGKEKIVYVRPNVMDLTVLAPYVDNKFYRSSFLSFGKRIDSEAIDHYSDFYELLYQIHKRKLAIDYVVLNKPLSEDGKWIPRVNGTGPFYVLDVKNFVGRQSLGGDREVNLSHNLDDANKSGMLNKPPFVNEKDWYSHPSANTDASIEFTNLRVSDKVQKLKFGYYLAHRRSTNGVLFQVFVDKKLVWAGERTDVGFMTHVIDFRGPSRHINLEFRISSKGNADNDWAHWWNPVFTERERSNQVKIDDGVQLKTENN